MCARQIDHVDVIANTRAIGSRIIFTIDLDVRAFACAACKVIGMM